MHSAVSLQNPRLDKNGWCVVEKDSHTAHVERADGRWWLHNTVTKWSRAVLREVKSDLAKIQGALDCDLWVLSPDPIENLCETSLFHKYVTRMGLIEVTPELDGDGCLCRTYILKRKGTNGKK